MSEQNRHANPADEAQHDQNQRAAQAAEENRERSDAQDDRNAAADDRSAAAQDAD